MLSEAFCSRGFVSKIINHDKKKKEKKKKKMLQVRSIRFDVVYLPWLRFKLSLKFLKLYFRQVDSRKFCSLLFLAIK